ncbi:MAG: glycyl-radical enzyme activating protein [Deltaproteobacteria bacterium]|nr:glycyl-radical enzyme activating protein [Deltaproteobacteria bacterium]
MRKGAGSSVDDQGLRGLVFDIQRFSLHDGPGIRTIVFLKGCPLSCIWCSNPESQEFNPQILFNVSKCIDCGTCETVCEKGAIRTGDHVDRIDRNACDECGCCCEHCPTEALKWSGKQMDVSQVLAEIEKDRRFYESSGGGVTFSGGEPLSQPVFLKNLLKACKLSGIHTAVETCGVTKWEFFQGILPYTQLFLYDLKHMDPLAHERFTGYDNRQVLDNLGRLCSKGANIIIRMPVIPGLNDSESNITATADLMVRLGIQEIHLLPYHNYGESKYSMLGLEYALKDLVPVSEQDLQAQRLLFEAHGINVNIGGE